MKILPSNQHICTRYPFGVPSTQRPHLHRKDSIRPKSP